MMRIVIVLLAAVLLSSIQAREILVMDWNGISQKHPSDGHIPKEIPPRPSANGNWHTPVNYAEGTLHFRMEVRSMPVPKEIFPMFCVWQQGTDPDKTDFGHEECVPYSGLVGVMGSSGNVKTWTYPLAAMKPAPGKLNQFLHIDYTRPRQQYGYGIKCRYGSSYGLVSDIKGYDWSGQNPDDWYPLDHRMTVVIVEKGGTFSGWHNYVYDEYTDVPAFSPAHGTFDGTGAVTLACPTPGARIYYTTDGTDPTDRSVLYTGPVVLAETCTLKAKAYADLHEPSGIVRSGTYAVSRNEDNVIVIEAETMDVDGYSTSRRRIQLPSDAGSGTAWMVFDGEPGVYAVSLSAIPEHDGQPVLALAVNNKDVAEERLPMHDDYMDLSYRYLITAAGVALHPGDTLKVTGTADSLATARLDNIILYRESAASISGIPGIVSHPGICLPNPMTGTAMFSVPEASDGMSVAIMDMNGRPVARIRGREWDGKDGAGNPCRPGLYSYMIQDGAERYGGTILKIR